MEHSNHSGKNTSVVLLVIMLAILFLKHGNLDISAMHVSIQTLGIVFAGIFIAGLLFLIARVAQRKRKEKKKARKEAEKNPHKEVKSPE